MPAHPMAIVRIKAMLGRVGKEFVCRFSRVFGEVLVEEVGVGVGVEDGVGQGAFVFGFAVGIVVAVGFAVAVGVGVSVVSSWSCFSYGPYPLSAKSAKGMNVSAAEFMQYLIPVG